MVEPDFPVPEVDALILDECNSLRTSFNSLSRLIPSGCQDGAAVATLVLAGEVSRLRIVCVGQAPLRQALCQDTINRKERSV